MDVIGKKFYSWTVISFSRLDKFRQPLYICRCDCGLEKEVNIYRLLRGNSQSCIKCSYKRRPAKHNLTRTRIYRIWENMKQRCYNEKNHKFRIYGARGIKICDEWLNDVTKFYEWSLKNGYADNLSIDRIDVNGDYCPENCRWATMVEQQNNKNQNIIINYKDEKFTLSEFCRKLNLNYRTIVGRIKIYKSYDGEIILQKPKFKPHPGKRKMITFNNETLSRKDWCDKLGIKESSYCWKQYKTKMSDDELINFYLKNSKDELQFTLVCPLSLKCPDWHITFGTKPEVLILTCEYEASNVKIV